MHKIDIAIYNTILLRKAERFGSYFIQIGGKAENYAGLRTSIAMGFYDPWASAKPDTKQGWSLNVIPVLWIDVLPKASAGEEKMFFPFLVSQSHPWGYRQDGTVMSWGQRNAALKIFAEAAGHDRYTEFALRDVFPFGAELPIPLAFLLRSMCQNAERDDEFKKALLARCQGLPVIWRSKFESQLSDLSVECFGALRKASPSLIDYRVHLNCLDSRAIDNDGTDKDDNSILFVRLNTGGETLRGEELIFSLFKSAFPKAKEAVENAAAGFMPPSHLFSLLVRVVSAGDKPTNLHTPLKLRDFKVKIADKDFKKRLEVFIERRVARVVSQARILLTGENGESNDPTMAAEVSAQRCNEFCLPPALATRTVREAPEVFLALLFWLNQGGETKIGSQDHRSLLAAITSLSWFASGNARRRSENLRKWMEAAQSSRPDEFWKPDTFGVLFTQSEDPIPGFPTPDDLQGFLVKAIVDNTDYKHLAALGEVCPKHEVFSGYSYLPMPTEVAADGVSTQADVQTREQSARRNLISLIGKLCGNKELVMFAQRSFITREFKNYQQWDLVLEDTDCPWDWDHIYPTAYCRRRVYPMYREWHNSVGNLRAEKLSANRAYGAAMPAEKLKNEAKRLDSFVPEDIWEMMTEDKEPVNIVKPEPAKKLSRIILTRMVRIYKEWYTTFAIDQIMAGVRAGR
ncbi:MAG: hypothetical protein ACP5O1_12435 [Phycisphaerae bacterium]